MAVAPAQKGISIYKGATLRKRFTLLSGAAGSAPRDLTGATAILTIRARPGGRVLLTLTNGSGLTLGGTLGTIDVLIAKESTALLIWKVASYDLKVLFPNGDTDTLLAGVVSVKD